MMKSAKGATGRLVSAMAVAAAFVTLTGGAQAQSNRPVTIVVPFAAGGGTDITTRAMQEGMSESLGVSVAVKNTAGAGGTIGVGEVARAKKDGTTLGMAPVGPLTTQPHLRKLPYDVDSFDYICLAYSAPTVIAVRQDSPFNNLEELVTYAKENPEGVTFAVQAIGSIPHIAGLALEDAAGIKMTYLPVDGDGPRAVTLGRYSCTCSSHLNTCIERSAAYRYTASDTRLSQHPQEFDEHGRLSISHNVNRNRDRTYISDWISLPCYCNRGRVGSRRQLGRVRAERQAR